MRSSKPSSTVRTPVVRPTSLRLVRLRAHAPRVVVLCSLVVLAALGARVALTGPAPPRPRRGSTLRSSLTPRRTPWPRPSPAPTPPGMPRAPARESVVTVALAEDDRRGLRYLAVPLARDDAGALASRAIPRWSGPRPWARRARPKRATPSRIAPCGASCLAAARLHTPARPPGAPEEAWRDGVSARVTCVSAVGNVAGRHGPRDEHPRGLGGRARSFPRRPLRAEA